MLALLHARDRPLGAVLPDRILLHVTSAGRVVSVSLLDDTVGETRCPMFLMSLQVTLRSACMQCWLDFMIGKNRCSSLLSSLHVSMWVS